MSDFLIKIITFSIIVRNIKFNNYAINKYIIFDIYIFDTKNNKLVKTFIIKKAYIVNSLKAKILVKINIISPKLIDFSVAQ